MRPLKSDDAALHPLQQRDGRGQRDDGPDDRMHPGGQCQRLIGQDHQRGDDMPDENDGQPAWRVIGAVLAEIQAAHIATIPHL